MRPRSRRARLYFPCDGFGLSAGEKDVYLNKIEVSGELLLALVNDTLTLSKASNGKIHLRPEPCQTQALGRSILLPISEMAEQKGIELTVDESGYRPRTVLLDRLNTEKIFLNLLTNAVRYTPAGGHVRVSVCDETPGAADTALVFVIQDDGIGMQRNPAAIYEPFARRTSCYEPANGWAAIGRRWCYHGGRSIESELDREPGDGKALFPETDAVETPEAAGDGSLSPVLKPKDPLSRQ